MLVPESDMSYASELISSAWRCQWWCATTTTGTPLVSTPPSTGPERRSFWPRHDEQPPTSRPLVPPNVSNRSSQLAHWVHPRSLPQNSSSKLATSSIATQPRLRVFPFFESFRTASGTAPPPRFQPAQRSPTCSSPHRCPSWVLARCPSWVLARSQLASCPSFDVGSSRHVVSRALVSISVSSQVLSSHWPRVSTMASSGFRVATSSWTSPSCVILPFSSSSSSFAKTPQYDAIYDVLLCSFMTFMTFFLPIHNL